MMSEQLTAVLLIHVITISMINGCCEPPPPPPPTPPPPPPPQGSLCSQSNFEEKGNYFEGDMILPNGVAKNHINSAARRWPGGTVPYVIEGTFSTSTPGPPGTDDQSLLNQALAAFNTRTGGCVKWIQRTNEANYVAITSERRGCWTFVGLLGQGRQQLNLQTGCPGCFCGIKGVAEHEMLHALGTFHEQSRPDRDNYVRINTGNIEAGKENNFDKYNPSQVLTHGAYEYGSVMHYSRCAFSSNHYETITALGTSANMGQRTGMTQLDINKLMKFYQC